MINLLFRAFLFVLCLSSTLVLAETPEQAITRIYSKLKQTGDPISIAEDIDWDEMLKIHQAKGSAAPGLTTGQEYKAWYIKYISKPSFETLVPYLGDVPTTGDKAKDEVIRSTFAQMIDKEIAALAEKAKAGLMRMNFRVGKATVTGESASVNIEIEVDGVKSNSIAKLTNKDGRWLMTQQDFDILNSLPPGLRDK